MIFLFEQSGAVSVRCTMTTECVTIQPADMALVVDVLLVAIERAAGVQGCYFLAPEGATAL